MRVHGLVFVGTRTRHVAAMREFVRDALGLQPSEHADATIFALPDGSSFAITEPFGLDAGERTVGFLVDDVEAAAQELAACGVPVDEVASNGSQRYVHFRAPDGGLYELVEDLTGEVAEPPYHG